VKYVNGAKKL